MLRFLWIILLIAASTVKLIAQDPFYTSKRDRKIIVEPVEQALDSMTVVPNSVKIHQLPGGELLDTSYFYVQNSKIIWRRPAKNLPAEIRVTYRVLPYNLARALARFEKDSVKLLTDAGKTVVGFDYNPYERNQELIDFQGLNYNGSFARGISFGNNQDLVLNSSFNLQLAGTLGNDVEIRAAITDENIPLQPEGNTQQLREFDKIFIQLKQGSNELTAGDYELRRPGSYFMNYFKKLQGATLSNQTEVLKNGKLSTTGSIAISRGQFARNNIAQQEGNQGPYKLSGNEGERFIIVLAGTEKVFFDGVLLNRGIEEDYIIDYNRGEITFTNKRLITKDSRIIVEFEYSDQNFNRTLYAVNSSYESKRLALNFNLFSEQDGKNTSGNQSLSDDQKRLLSLAGDDFQSSFASSIDTLDEFSSLRIAYQLIDTLTTCGRSDSVLVYSVDPEIARNTARFTFVGQGNGDYVLDSEVIANERVYRWVAPDSVSCLPRGDYAAVFQLIAPKQQQMMTFGGSYQLDENTSFQAEIALSRKDQNRFSDLDTEDDNGLAFYTTFDRLFRLSDKEKGWTLRTNAQYEFTEENFTALNPYRSREFLRDWNLVNVQGIGHVEKASENILRGGIELQKEETLDLNYRVSSFSRGSIYQGIRQFGRFHVKGKGWDIDLATDYLSAREPEQKTTFSRPKIQLVKIFEKWKGWKLGGSGERERSSRTGIETDTLIANSFYFDRYRLFLESPEQKAAQLNLNFSQRFDYQPAGEEFRLNAEASELNINGGWRARNILRLAGNLTYRNLEVKQSTNLVDRSETGETFLGRTDLNLNIAKGSIRFNSTYEVGSGQEPKLEFSYIRVAQGEGTHIWLDSLFNNDGIIQPNEMEVAPFQDRADYVKITTFTNEFIRTNNVNLNQSLQLNPKAVWFSAEGIRKFLARFSTQSTLKINRKTQESAEVSAWNPFDIAIADTSLVSVASNIRNILFFNRGNAAFDIQLGRSDNRNKFVQTSGFESRQLQETFLKTRINFSRQTSLQVSYTNELRISDSEFFNTKDYNIRGFRLDPQFTYQPSKNIRFSLQYQYQNDENQLPQGGETSIQQELNFEAAFNKSAKTTVRSRFSYVRINFSGETNSPVGFAMLNGLQNGRNLLWNVNLDRQLAQNIRLNVGYDGRQTGENRMVHVGRVQVAAVF